MLFLNLKKYCEQEDIEIFSMIPHTFLIEPGKLSLEVE